MALATVYSRARQGLDAPLVGVEVHLANGLPGFSLVGLPEAAVRESKDRVRAAIINSGFRFPTRRITVNLAPADLPKDGGRFDLPIAIGILQAAGEIQVENLDQQELLGELSLSGAIRPVLGALPAVLASRDADRELIVPAENTQEASLVSGARVYAASDLLSVCAHLCARERLSAVPHAPAVVSSDYAVDMSEVRGQQQAKRALEVAAAGAHHLLLEGPPGSGKSMLAARFSSILPPLSDDEALAVAAIRSVSQGKVMLRNWRQRPYRSPHHTASAIALAGGGAQVRPGEISLAHHGVLFLDELPEFSRQALEILREPLESGEICLSRAAGQLNYPAEFQLIAAMNPCPCGWLGDASGRCHCTQTQVHKYRAKISGPLLDRIDMHLRVQPVALEQLSLSATAVGGACSADIRARVCEARLIQHRRQGKANGKLSPKEMETVLQMSAQAQRLADQALTRMQLSARSYHRVLKVAMSIADLAGAAIVDVVHLSEALQYRQNAQ